MFSLFLHSKTSPKGLGQQAGFGLVELVVSISIMVAVSSVILVKHNAFNGAVLLRNQAYQIALTTREVQLNAVSVSGISGNYRSLLGLYFNTNSNGEYKIFKDADNDQKYDATELFGKQGILDQKFEIRAIRKVLSSGTEASLEEVSIVFERPNFDARFYGPSGEISDATAIEIDIARRNVESGGSDVIRTIEVTSAGQIAVQ